MLKRVQHDVFSSNPSFRIYFGICILQMLKRVQHDGVCFVLRPTGKYSTPKKKMFCDQKQNVPRPRRKCSTPNRKMFCVQEENILRPKSKCSTSKIKNPAGANKKAVRHKKCAARQNHSNSKRLSARTPQVFSYSPR